jgi:hypothetical protein
VFLRYQKGEKKMEKEEKGKNQNQSQNKEQQSFLGAASFTKEGAVGSNPTPRTFIFSNDFGVEKACASYFDSDSEFR